MPIGRREIMKIGLVINWNKNLAEKFVSELANYFKKKNIDFVIIDSLPPRPTPKSATRSRKIKTVDLVLAVGGDGTLLRAVRLVAEKEIPIMGINLGSLGFLTAFSINEALKSIDKFLKGNYRIEKRIIMQVTFGKNSSFAFNDCAINMGKTGRVIEINVNYRNEFVNKFVGDGIIVATPTGSTAYSLAAGGPVVYPTIAAFILTPICPHALAARPIILPATEAIELQLSGKSKEAILNLDGQVRWQLRSGQSVSIKQADFFVNLVFPKERSYFEILRNKLKWAGTQ